MTEPRPRLPEPRLIAQLLDMLQVTYDPKRLQQAAASHQADPEAVRAWLRQVLRGAAVNDVAALQVPWSRFDPTRLPALVAWRQRWFLARRHDDGVRLTDAAGSDTLASPDDLADADVLWLRAPADPDAPLHATDNLAARLVWSELLRERGWLWKLVLATCLVNVLGISTALFAMQVYDRVVPTLAYATLTTLVAGMVIIVALDWTLKTLRARILDSLSCAVDQRVSARVFDHLLHVQLDAQPRTLGSLAAQVGSLEAIRQFFSATVVFALVDLPFALMFLAFIAIIGGAVAWVYALLLPAALLLGLFAQWRLRRLLRAQLSRSNERQGLLVDSIRGAESIRASNAGWRFSAQWQEITASINRHAIQQRAVNSLSSVTTTSLSTTAYVAGVVVGVWQIEAGLLTMGGLIACSILGGRIIAPVAQSVHHLVQWQHVRQALQQLHDVLALRAERPPRQALLLPDTAPDSLALEGVRFAYADSPVCQLDVERLRLAAGDRILLLGPVGSGKSTLLKVLAGLYRPDQGRVRFGQAELWEVDPLLVSNQLGYLPQSVHLFRGTLRSNVCLGSAGSDDRLLQVSRALGIDGVAAASPLGMATPISEGGEGLSGGQRQLVALGRLFMTAPRIWLLDEPTASLDRDAEQRVWTALEAALGTDDILIVSTHRPLLASRLVNRVLIMQQGRIVRDDKPEVLLPQMLRPSTKPQVTPGGNVDVV